MQIKSFVKDERPLEVLRRFFNVIPRRLNERKNGPQTFYHDYTAAAAAAAEMRIPWISIQLK